MAKYVVFSKKRKKYEQSYGLPFFLLNIRWIRVAINSTVAPEKKGIFGLFQKGKQKVTYVIANYESAEANVRKIEKDLQRHQQVLTKDVCVIVFMTVKYSFLLGFWFGD